MLEQDLGGISLWNVVSYYMERGFKAETTAYKSYVRSTNFMGVALCIWELHYTHGSSIIDMGVAVRILE